MPSLRINPEYDILAVIDMQNDFLPGGSLAVNQGDEIIPVINHLLDQVFTRSFATQDWHPNNHISFASSHKERRILDKIKTPYGDQILWPDHAIENTKGADFPPDLMTHKCQIILRKGWHKEIDSYSAFQENDRKTQTGLAGYLKALDIQRIFFTGLAEDFCVRYSVEDALAAGFETFIIQDATRPVNLSFENETSVLNQSQKKLLSLGNKYIRLSDLI